MANVCIGFIRYFLQTSYKDALYESTSTKALFPDFDLAYNLHFTVPNCVFTVLFESSKLFRVFIYFCHQSLHRDSLS